MSDKIILLVEDNPDDEALALRALKKNLVAGKVIVVRDGAEALDYLFCRAGFAQRDPRHQPDVLLLDLNLPKISGLEVLKRLRAEPATKLLPVVVLTTSNEERDVVSSYQLGANSYIRKPVDFERFTEAIGQLASYWLGLNVGPPVQV